LTPRRIALAAALLVVPSLIVVVAVVARRAKPAVTSAPAAAEAVAVTAGLDPYHSLAFTELSPSAPPAAETCEAAMSAMEQLGGHPAFVGRLRITLRATRSVQLRVDKVTILTVRREDAQVAAMATCAEPETPSPTPGETAFDETFPFGSDGFSYFTPVVRLTDQYATSAPPIVVPFVDPTSIDDSTFDFRAGTTGVIPVYVLSAGGPTFRSGFQVAVDLTINGLLHHETLTDAGAPFWLYETGFRQGDGPIHRWTPGTKTWQSF